MPLIRRLGEFDNFFMAYFEKKKKKKKTAPDRKRFY